ncbi:MAG TPA: nicotinate phosphoribosyltransferase, partial [Candidatus Avamphibacillus sp.]|nr:nicotinate phosphoribosyltransferase [Candidatus Avamphibacillus sp.]
KIMVSGGFTEERINHFEVLGVPVDMYGVGGSLLQINIGFTGDNVLLNGTPAAKEGRSYRPNPRLERVEYRKQDR